MFHYAVLWKKAGLCHVSFTDFETKEQEVQLAVMKSVSSRPNI